MNFPMPRLASPAIPNIHSMSGLSSLHLMQQQHNLSGNGDLISNRTRNRSNDSRTPPHTETSKQCHSESMNRNEKSVRHSNTIEQHLKHLSKGTSSSNNNNNNSKEPSVSEFTMLYNVLNFILCLLTFLPQSNQSNAGKATCFSKPIQNYGCKLQFAIFRNSNFIQVKLTLKIEFYLVIVSAGTKV